MNRLCRQCRSAFNLELADLKILERLSPVINGDKLPLPPPAFCPDCRLRHRLAFRNQHFIYVRSSGSTSKKLFSVFPENAPFPVIDNEEWWGDSWDAMRWGQDYDFTQQFFPQFAALRNLIPHIARNAFGNEECDYCNNIIHSRNCYLSFNGTKLDGCIHVESAYSTSDCLDCTRMSFCELCCDCVQCSHCYMLQSSAFCEQCRDSYFLRNCRSCANCFCCVNLRNKRFCIFNRQHSAEEYTRYLRKLSLSSFSERQAIADRFMQFALLHPVPHTYNINAEESSGCFLDQTKNVHHSFFIRGGEDLRYCFNLNNGIKDCCDVSIFGESSELLYECAMSGINCRNLHFCNECWMGCTNLLYCMYCVECRNCFGCTGLKRKQFCILNKQYSAEDYYSLVAKIVVRMEETGEWGAFFPMTLSPLPYNQSLAAYYFPLTQEECQRQNLCFQHKRLIEAAQSISTAELPDGLPETDGSIVVQSAASGIPFRITAQEIKRRRAFGVPLPRTTYDERMDERSRILGGIAMYRRTCAKTGRSILTAYEPDTPWIVWDKAVYDREFA